MAMKKSITAGDALKQGVMLVSTFLALVPTLFMIATALKSDEEYAIDKLGLPDRPVIENFRAVLVDSPFLIWMANSMILVMGAVLLSTVVSCLAAYAIACMNFRGRETLLALSTSLMAVPPVVMIVPLFVLYTSGSTGKPKGILHTSGGYLTGTYSTCKYIFDMRDEDVYWCTADVGWITGHSYIVYGPLANGVTQVMYEGAPNQPDFGRFWKMIEEYGVTIFYTAPTAIRAFIKAGDHFPKAHDLSSLRLLGSVGEPINPEAWNWYHKHIGGGKCPIVDTWWQTETGAILISPLPGATPCKPGTATLPFFGIDAAILDDAGNECKNGQDGRLVIRKPWPSMIRSIYGDKERYKKTYWSDYPGGIYTAGDGARRDKEGNFWIIGRLDDVLNVSGHRLGTAEIESALVSHPAVAEAAVVGRPDEMKGQAVAAFVTLKGNYDESEALRIELRNHVGKVIGAIAKPDDLHFAVGLPKTRSGKIMRRLLKELVCTGKISGNVTTLEDISVIESLQRKIAK